MNFHCRLIVDGFGDDWVKIIFASVSRAKDMFSSNMLLLIKIESVAALIFVSSTSPFLPLLVPSILSFLARLFFRRLYKLIGFLAGPGSWQMAIMVAAAGRWTLAGFFRE